MEKLKKFDLETALEFPDAVCYSDGSCPVDWHYFDIDDDSGGYIYAYNPVADVFERFDPKGKKFLDGDNPDYNLYLLPDTEYDYTPKPKMGDEIFIGLFPDRITVKRIFIKFAKDNGVICVDPSSEDSYNLGLAFNTEWWGHWKPIPKKPSETIKIGEHLYSKEEVENRLKDLKPVK